MATSNAVQEKSNQQAEKDAKANKEGKANKADKKSIILTMQQKSNEILERYKELHKEKSDKKNDKEIITTLMATVKSSVNSAQKKIEDFPELKKFIEETDKDEDIESQWMILSGCGVLERTLFRAIADLNFQLIENLIELGVDVNKKIALPRFRMNKILDTSAIPGVAPSDFVESNKVYLTPIYAVLASANMNNSTTLFSLEVGRVTEVNAARMHIIIVDLIRAGALIEHEVSLGSGKGGSTFLHRLVLMTLENPELHELLTLILDCSQINVSEDGLIPNLLSSAVSKLKTFGELSSAIKTSVKNVVQLLVNKRFCDYSHVFLRGTLHHISLYDILIKFLKTQNDKDVIEVINIIFEAMAMKNVNALSKLKFREFRDTKNALIKCCGETLNVRDEKLHPTLDPIEYNKSSIKIYSTATAANEHSSKEPDTSLEATVLNTALKHIEECRSIGVAIARHHSYLGIKEIWEIVKGYCGHVAFINDGYHFAMHIALPETFTQQQLSESFSSHQIVPYTLNSVISTIETNPIYTASLSDEELHKRGVRSDVVTPDLKETHDNIHSYNHRLVVRGPGGYGIRMNRFVVQRSLQGNHSVISYFDDQGKPEPAAFLYLYREKKPPKPDRLRLAWRHQDVADELDVPNNDIEALTFRVSK